MYGQSTATSSYAYGVYGYSASTAGRGVYGYASATSGITYGVYGQSASTDGRGVYGTSPFVGVYGYASAASGYTYGVYAQSASTTGSGVYGTSPYVGVYGWTSSTSGYAGYFHGKVTVNGTLSKSAGSFKIDHPLDPANKYLYHSFVESPDMKNIYDGVVTLDANGEATVTLPDWFEALNRDFRYQLTPIGAAMPNLYIAEEIQGNTFRIAGGVPGQKVSWQVTGIRHDPYAEEHRIPVEEDKPAEEKGTYLYPEGYGQPQEVGLDYQRNADLLNAPDGQ